MRKKKKTKKKKERKFWKRKIMGAYFCPPRIYNKYTIIQIKQHIYKNTKYSYSRNKPKYVQNSIYGKESIINNSENVGYPTE